MMKRLLFLILSFVFVYGCRGETVAAQRSKIRVSPRIGIWKLTGKDTENTAWQGQIRFTQKNVLEKSVKYKGYFNWLSSDRKTSGREDFTGSFNKQTGILRLRSLGVKNNKGELAPGNYKAFITDKGKRISRGRWSGDNIVSGSWSARWLRFK